MSIEPDTAPDADVLVRSMPGFAPPPECGPGAADRPAVLARILQLRGDAA